MDPGEWRQHPDGVCAGIAEGVLQTLQPPSRLSNHSSTSSFAVNDADGDDDYDGNRDTTGLYEEVVLGGWDEVLGGYVVLESDDMAESILQDLQAQSKPLRLKLFLQPQQPQQRHLFPPRDLHDKEMSYPRGGENMMWSSTERTHAPTRQSTDLHADRKREIRFRASSSNSASASTNHSHISSTLSFSCDDDGDGDDGGDDGDDDDDDGDDGGDGSTSTAMSGSELEEVRDNVRMQLEDLTRFPWGKRGKRGKERQVSGVSGEKGKGGKGRWKGKGADSPVPGIGRMFPRFSAVHESPFNVDADHPFVNGKYKITVYDYSRESVDLFEAPTVEALSERPRPQSATMRWIHVEGIDREILEELAALYDLHPLAVEDAMTTPQLAKVMRLPNQLFAVFNAFHMHFPEEGGKVAAAGNTSVPGVDAHVHARSPGDDDDDGEGKSDGGSESGSNEPSVMEDQAEFRLEQIAVFTTASDRTCISVQEGKYPEGSFLTVWQPVLARLRFDGSKVRQHGAAFLLYTILDSVVDHVAPITAYWSMQLEELDLAMTEETPSSELDAYVGAVRRLKRELQLLRRLLWPMSSMTMRLQQEDDAVDRTTRLYLSDVTDHIKANVEAIDTFMETADSMVDFVADSRSQRMDDVMRTLTVISTIFIPASWLASNYGVNFAHNVPELEWQYGYAAYVAICVVQAVIQIIWFRKIGWL